MRTIIAATTANAVGALRATRFGVGYPKPIDGQMSLLGPSRHLLRLHEGGRYRSEADTDED